MTEEPDNKSRGITDSAVSDAAEVGKTLISGITPADKGWILGFIMVVFIIVGSDAWISIRTLARQEAQSERTAEVWSEIENNRAAQFDTLMNHSADQARRYQETIRALTESVARDSERAGAAAVSALDQASRRTYIEQSAPPNPDFIGPPTAEQSR